MSFRALSQRGGLPVLEHLNLSGCLFITEVGLQELVSVCPALNDEHFYYCDNINGILLKFLMFVIMGYLKDMINVHECHI